jgi:hypothetical protein
MGLISVIEYGCALAELSTLVFSMLIPLAVCLAVAATGRLAAWRGGIDIPWSFVEILAVAVPLVDVIFLSLLLFPAPSQ